MRPVALFKIDYSGYFHSPINTSLSPWRHLVFLLTNLQNKIYVKHETVKMVQRSVSESKEGDFNSFRCQVLDFFTCDGEEYSFKDYSAFPAFLANQ